MPKGKGLIAITNGDSTKRFQSKIRSKDRIHMWSVTDHISAAQKWIREIYFTGEVLNNDWIQFLFRSNSQQRSLGSNRCQQQEWDHRNSTWLTTGDSFWTRSQSRCQRCDDNIRHETWFTEISQWTQLSYYFFFRSCLILSSSAWADLRSRRVRSGTYRNSSSSTSGCEQNN